MLCARCKKNPASVHIKQIVDNQVSESRLCAECAGLEVPGPAAPALLGLLSLLGAAAARERPPAARCGACGLRWTDFKKTGFLGCHACYEAFAEPLKGLLKEMQGSVKHVGKVPAPSSAPRDAGRRAEEGAALRSRLDDALKREAYEEAARLRDQLRRLKGA